MRVSFRQGIVRYQTDIVENPTFLKPIGNNISLIVSPDPTLIAFAHGISDYLFEEQVTIEEAWGSGNNSNPLHKNGPFISGTVYWLYWDIDIVSGIRTFGHTSLQPQTSSKPPNNPQIGLMWFDLTNTVMNVWNGTRWINVIRVMAGKFSGGVSINPYTVGTQVGLLTPVQAGFILYDDDDNPVKKYDRFNRGKFITTETPLASQLSRMANFSLEAEIVEASAIENIPKWHCVAYVFTGKIGLARPTDINHPCIGIAREEIHTSESRNFISRGHIRDPNFNWTQPVSSPVFVGANGIITPFPSQTYSIQQVGIVVSPKILFIDIRPKIIYG